jgi:hypothetical protein
MFDVNDQRTTAAATAQRRTWLFIIDRSFLLVRGMKVFDGGESGPASSCPPDVPVRNFGTGNVQMLLLYYISEAK